MFKPVQVGIEVSSSHVAYLEGAGVIGARKDRWVDDVRFVSDVCDQMVSNEYTCF